MATVLHSWLSRAQETTRYDSVAAKYGLVVDTPGMSQTGHNALRFLRSLSEHSPTFFEGQARLLVGALAGVCIVLILQSPTSALTTPMGAQRPARRTSRADPDEALFALDDPLFQSRAHRARPYPALPRIHPDLVAAPLGASSALKHLPQHQAVQSFAQQHVQPPLLSFAPSEPEPVRTPDDADRARISAFMYGSMRAHTVAASETDTQRW